MVHNTIDFVGETNLPFALWSRDPFFKDQSPKNGQKSAIGYIANIDQHKIIFPLTPNLFLRTKIFYLSRHGQVTSRYQQKMYTSAW